MPRYVLLIDDAAPDNSHAEVWAYGWPLQRDEALRAAERLRVQLASQPDPRMMVAGGRDPA